MPWEEPLTDDFGEYSHLARETDPIESHQAAYDYARSCKREHDEAHAFSMVCRFPGRTSRELDAMNETPEGVIRKRLKDLERDGRIRRGPARVSVIDGKAVGKASATWWPAEATKQAVLF